jgi:hypothetical protein
VLFAESPKALQFSFEDEDLLVALAGHLGAAIDLMQSRCDEAAEPVTAPSPARRAPAADSQPLKLRRFRVNDSIFIGDDYLIKGVAGAILWRLLRSHVEDGRSDHTNRELRLDPAIHLPDLSENLEARLILLTRRLEERCPALRVEKTGRGRFRFHVLRPVALEEIAR